MKTLIKGLVAVFALGVALMQPAAAQSKGTVGIAMPPPSASGNR